MKTHFLDYFSKVSTIAKSIDVKILEDIINGLVCLRNSGGRLFMIGVGGSAANCSHAVNDFRKIADIETYSPCDNVSELTARTNDEGWDTIFAAWLKTSKLNDRDAVMVLSVGGGDSKKNVSPNIVKALDFAKSTNTKIFGIVGRDGGYTKRVGDAVIVIPTADEKLITPLSESFQSVVLHGIVCHPEIAKISSKWETVDKYIS